MRIVVILDVKPKEGERGRTAQEMVDALEPEIEAISLEVANDPGDLSVHEVKVLGIGRTFTGAEATMRTRRAQHPDPPAWRPSG